MERVTQVQVLVAVNLAVGVLVVAFLAFSSLSAHRPGGSGEAIDPGGSSPGSVPGAGSSSGTVPSVNLPPPLPPGETWIPGPRLLPEEDQARVRRTVRLVKDLLLAIELYHAARGEYPDSELAGGNARNEGSEALYAQLTAAGYLPDLDRMRWTGNTDEDFFPEDALVLDAPPVERERRELLDAWGNPLIYCRFDRFEFSTLYVIGGEEQVVAPGLSRVTGEYHGARYVQIWSAGPNGENENGGGDEVTSWHIRD